MSHAGTVYARWNRSRGWATTGLPSDRMMSPGTIGSTLFGGYVCAVIVIPVVVFILILRTLRRNLLTAALVAAAGAVVAAVTVGIFSAGLMNWLFQSLAQPGVQAAVDAQCGSGVMVVDAGDIDMGSMGDYYGSDRVSCQYPGANDDWVCQCRTPVPR